MSYATTRPDLAGSTDVDFSDLYKIRDALAAAVLHHEHRDQSNAALHLGPVRHSPLTSELQTALERIDWYLKPTGDAT